MYRLIKQMWFCEWMYLCALGKQVRNPSFGFVREVKKHLWFFLLFQAGISILVTVQMMELREFEELLRRMWNADSSQPRSLTPVVARKEEIISYLLFLYPIILMSYLFYRKVSQLFSRNLFEELRTSPTKPLDYVAFNTLVFGVFGFFQVIIGLVATFCVESYFFYESFYIFYFGRMLLFVLLISILVFPFLLILAGTKKYHLICYLLLIIIPAYVLFSLVKIYAPYGLFSNFISQYLPLGFVPIRFFSHQVILGVILLFHLLFLLKLKDSFIFTNK